MEPKFSQILPTEIKTQERVIYMALNKEVLVEMPVHCVRAKKDKAVYVLRSVRIGTKKGSRPVSVYRYVYVGKKKQIELPAFVRNCGMYASFSGISEILGLGKLLEKHFGQERAKEILTIAHYMMVRGNVMYYLPDWMEDTVTFGGNHLTSVGISRLFSGITANERICFFNDWMKRRKNTEYLAYDVTSISSYGKNMESLEWGYNRDKEKLPQVNVGMYFGEESKLPLYYRVYPGSIPDKAHLKYVTEDNEVISSRKMRFVMDRGFYFAENMQYLV